MTNFHKYHGAGNDFIMINNLKGSLDLKPEYIKSLCDRHFGIGADGVILIEPSEKANCFMNYYNSDGTLAEMCGNGVRCATKFFLEQSDKNIEEVLIDTRAGIKKITCNSDDTYSVNMGEPVFAHTDFPAETKKIEGLDFNFVSMGNPHAVTIVDSLNGIDIKTIGPKIENNPLFPNKINVEFVEKITDGHYKVLVWERGCGATLACGTGACAVFSVLGKTSHISAEGKAFRKSLGEITLEFPGGKLFLSKDHEDIILRGPATFVFKGEIQ